MGSNTATTYPKRMNDAWRAKIKTGLLINRLQDHAVGKVEMTSTQIQAAKILLSKVAPDLQQTNVNSVHSVSHTVRHIEIAPVKPIAHQPAPALIEGEYVDATPATAEVIANKKD